MKQFIKYLKIVYIIILLLFVTTGCTKKISNNNLKIVCTNFPCYDFARAVCPGADINMLLKPGMEVHSFDPTPQDILKMDECNIFIFIGGESDEWVYEVFSSIDKKDKQIIMLMDAVEPVSEDGNEYENDEHIWTSPENAIRMIDMIADKVSQYDSKNAKDYITNAQNYIVEVAQAQHEMYASLHRMEGNTIVIGDRFPFKYFALEFGIQYFAAFNGCSSAIGENPATIAFLIDKIKEYNLKKVFYIELSNHKIADSIAEQCGIKTAMLHSAQNVTKAEFESGIKYTDIIRMNAKALED